MAGTPLDLVSSHTRYPFFSCRLRSRTPGPPPFSSMNSTPAASKARFITSTVAVAGCEPPLQIGELLRPDRCLFGQLRRSNPKRPPRCPALPCVSLSDTSMQKVTDSINSVEKRLTLSFLSFTSQIYLFTTYMGYLAMHTTNLRRAHVENRRQFIGGSDARIIMGKDEAALLRLWREKRGEVEPEDLSGNLLVHLGLATEELNRRWYEANTSQAIRDVQRQVRHPTVRWMGATLDGRVEGTGAVFEAKFMLPWSFSEEAAAEKYMAQLQHNMWVVASRAAVLSVITGGGKWVEITTHADPLYQHLIVTAERKFWRCVESGEPPRLFGVEPPKPRIQAVRIVDMSGSNAWAEFAGIFARTRAAHLEHEQAKTELKSLMPEDAKEAIGHGVRAKRSKSGAVSFDLLVQEGSPHAAVE